VIRGGVSNHEPQTHKPSAKEVKPAPVFNKKQDSKGYKPVVAKKEQKPSNVIPLKAAKKKVKAEPVAKAESSSDAAPEFKMAAGESTTPSRDSDGFDE